MLEAYFDDSGTHSDSEVVSIGGSIGTPAQRAQFDREWRALLACPLKGKPRLSRFHLTNCNARDGEFRGYTDGECDAVTYDFRQILIRSGVYSTVFSIDKRAWDELVTGDSKQWLGEAVDNCVEQCMVDVLRIAGTHREGDRVAVVFDKGMWTARLKEITDQFTWPISTPRIISVSFLPVADFTPLQGADITATESYWHAIQVLRDGYGAQPRPHMRHYLEHTLAEGFIIDRAKIVEHLPEMLAYARELREAGSRPA